MHFRYTSGRTRKYVDQRVLEYADNTSAVFPDESLTGLQFMYHTKIVRHINSELNVEKEVATSSIQRRTNGRWSMS